MLYVLNQRSRANILGITVPGSGEAHCKHAIGNVLDLIHLVGREKENIKVSCGDEVPMEGVTLFLMLGERMLIVFMGLKSQKALKLNLLRSIQLII